MRNVRWCSAATATRKQSFVETLLSKYRTPPPAAPQVSRLLEGAKLYTDPDVSSPVLEDLAAGSLIETFADLDGDMEWVLVRTPLEDNIDIMSDKPLEYQDGWMHYPSLELSKHQVGDKIAARVEAMSHPLLLALKRIPPWRNASLPNILVEAVSEFHTGKIGGVVKRGRFMVQRPSGAIPERIATKDSFLFTPRQRQKRTFVSVYIGLVWACILASVLHMRKWFMLGRSREEGRFAWVTLCGYWVVAAVFLTPFCIWPCYSFSISHFSTASSVWFVNMLLYMDLFSE